MTTTSVEDYLKAIRELQRDKAQVTTCELAHHLHVAPASVTGMMQRLAKELLVIYVPYHGVSLTKLGEQVASTVWHRHEIIEQYLVNAIGFTLDDAHAEAERLEHVMSYELVNKIERTLIDKNPNQP
jgi:DtxR family Mn-dependent transcriptional regulator